MQGLLPPPLSAVLEKTKEGGRLKRVCLCYPFLLYSPLCSLPTGGERRRRPLLQSSPGRSHSLGMAAGSASATTTLSVAAAAAAALRVRRQGARAWAPSQPARQGPLLRLKPCASLAPHAPAWRAESDGAGGGAGAGDVMGLLLRERIVFLGNEIEDFLADAVVSQLLLLDAVDPHSDIRLFVNSSGGSLRYAPLFSFPLPGFHFKPPPPFIHSSPFEYS